MNENEAIAMQGTARVDVGATYSYEGITDTRAKKSFYLHKPMFSDKGEVVRKRGERLDNQMATASGIQRQFELGRLLMRPEGCSCQWCQEYADHEIVVPQDEIDAEERRKRAAMTRHRPLVSPDGRMFVAVDGQMVEVSPLETVGDAEGAVAPLDAIPESALTSEPPPSPVINSAPGGTEGVCPHCGWKSSATTVSNRKVSIERHVEALHRPVNTETTGAPAGR